MGDGRAAVYWRTAAAVYDSTLVVSNCGLQSPYVVLYLPAWLSTVCCSVLTAQRGALCACVEPLSAPHLDSVDEYLCICDSSIECSALHGKRLLHGFVAQESRQQVSTPEMTVIKHLVCLM
jgi:hypothetical protein